MPFSPYQVVEELRKIEVPNLVKEYDIRKIYNDKNTVWDLFPMKTKSSDLIIGSMVKTLRDFSPITQKPDAGNRAPFQMLGKFLAQAFYLSEAFTVESEHINTLRWLQEYREGVHIPTSVQDAIMDVIMNFGRAVEARMNRMIRTVHATQVMTLFQESFEVTLKDGSSGSINYGIEHTDMTGNFDLSDPNADWYSALYYMLEDYRLKNGRNPEKMILGPRFFAYLLGNNHVRRQAVFDYNNLPRGVHALEKLLDTDQTFPEIRQVTDTVDVDGQPNFLMQDSADVVLWSNGVEVDTTEMCTVRSLDNEFQGWFGTDIIEVKAPKAYDVYISTNCVPVVQVPSLIQVYRVASGPAPVGVEPVFLSGPEGPEGPEGPQGEPG